MPLALVAAQAGGGEGQHRPQPLAAGRDNVPGQLRDQRHRAVHPPDDQRVDPTQVGTEQPEQRIERGLRHSVGFRHGSRTGSGTR